ncbi:hypothetical protein [Lysobacter gummosus]|uniref:hypothetical protein n=1 Tax=Lysobacter gummosus TaxID=262324 RepID=UPI00363B0724
MACPGETSRGRNAPRAFPTTLAVSRPMPGRRTSRGLQHPPSLHRRHRLATLCSRLTAPSPMLPRPARLATATIRVGSFRRRKTG